ncbi:MAG: glycine cleavage system protein GcvH [Gammaproteobacteria bacterium]
MSNIPDDLHYTHSHEWIREEEDGTVTIGITHHAQELLGDIVYVELPEVGSTTEAGMECAVLESVKAAADLFAPLSGEIEAVNELLCDTPGAINSDPYDAGWVFRLNPSNPDEIVGLMDAEAYADDINE